MNEKKPYTTLAEVWRETWMHKTQTDVTPIPPLKLTRSSTTSLPSPLFQSNGAMHNLLTPSTNSAVDLIIPSPQKAVRVKVQSSPAAAQRWQNNGKTSKAAVPASDEKSTYMRDAASSSSSLSSSLSLRNNTRDLTHTVPCKLPNSGSLCNMMYTPIQTRRASGPHGILQSRDIGPNALSRVVPQRLRAMDVPVSVTRRCLSASSPSPSAPSAPPPPPPPCATAAVSHVSAVPPHQREQSPLIHADQSDSFISSASYVGAAVGTSGQKPFIRRVTRLSGEYHVMPSFASRQAVLARADSVLSEANEHKRECNDKDRLLMSINNASVMAARSRQCVSPTEKKDAESPSPGGMSSSMYHHICAEIQTAQMRANGFRRSHTVGCNVLRRWKEVDVSENNIIAHPRSFARQVSPLCLSVLRERDRRLELERAVKEQHQHQQQQQQQLQQQQDQHQGQLNHEQVLQPIAKSSLRVWGSASRYVCPAQTPPQRLTATETMNAVPTVQQRVDSAPAAALLQRVRGMLEQRRLSLGDLRDEHTTNGCMTKSNGHGTHSDHAAIARRDLSPIHPRNPNVRIISHNIPENKNEKKNIDFGEPFPWDDDEDEYDDEGELGDEDTLWCFGVFWCGPLEPMPPPPPFVPRIDLSSVSVPRDDDALLSMYAIAMQSVTTAVSRMQRVARPRALSVAFTDQSDAFAGGRGSELEAKQRARKWRIDVLLLESYERRGRRMIQQEETSMRKAVLEGM